VPAGSELVDTEGAGVTVTVTDADFVEAATEVAVIVTLVLALTDAGAL
jgi:hypothetical protein